MKTIKNLFSFLGPNITLLILYFLMTLVIFAFYGVNYKFDHFKLWSVLLSTLFVFYFTTTLIRHAKHKEEDPTPFIPFAWKQLWKFVKDWFPLVALVTIYENLREYTGIIRTDQIDAALMKADIWLFGVEPTVWIQQFTHPILTEYFAFTYSTYLILPLALGWYYYACRRDREYHTLTMGVILTLCVGYALYLTFPAGPPRFFIPEMFDPPQLVGYFGFYNSMQTRFDSVNPMMYRASFPSLHVGLSSVALLFAVKYRNAVPLGKIIQFIVGLLAVSLWIATVYLRHHWVVDIFAGWALALGAFYASQWIEGHWPKRQ